VLPACRERGEQIKLEMGPDAPEPGLGRAAEEIVKLAVPAAMALTVTGPLKPARAVTVKLPLVAPAGTEMVLGTDKSVLLLLRSTTLVTPAGVGPFMVTVHTAVPSAARTEGAQATEEGGGQPT
jgi:hypothetical protein